MSRRRHGTHTREHRTTDRRERVERHVGRDTNGARFGDDDAVGKARGAEKRRDGLIARAQMRRARGQLVAECHLVEAIAENRASVEARGAHAARRRPAQHDVIVLSDPGDAGADLADDARPFVTEDDRRFHRPVAARGMQIAVTHAGRAHLHEHLAGPRRTEIDRLDREGTALFPQDGGVDAHQIGRRLYCGVIGLSTRRRPHSRC